MWGDATTSACRVRFQTTRHAGGAFAYRITCANRKYGIARARHDDSSPFASPAFARPTPFGVYLCGVVSMRKPQSASVARNSATAPLVSGVCLEPSSSDLTQRHRQSESHTPHHSMATSPTRTRALQGDTSAQMLVIVPSLCLSRYCPPIRRVPSHISERQSTHRLAESVAVQAISNRRQVTHAPSIAARR